MNEEMNAMAELLTLLAAAEHKRLHAQKLKSTYHQERVGIAEDMKDIKDAIKKLLSIPKTDGKEV